MQRGARLGVIGIGPLAHDLVGYGASLAGWNALICAPLDETGPEPARLAAALGATCVAQWQDVALAADAVLILGEGARRIDATDAMLRAGRPVVVPGLVEADVAAIARLEALSVAHGVAFLPLGEVTSLSLCAEARHRIAQPEFGRLHSIYASAHVARGVGPAVLRRLRWEMLGLVLAVTEQPVRRVHATPGAMHPEAPGADVEVILLRFADDLIATIELAACLPRHATREEPPEIAFEAIGARRVVRVEPDRPAVCIAGDDRLDRVAFTDPAIIPMLAALRQALDAPSPAVSGLAQRTARVMGLVDQSLQRGCPILPE